MNPPGFASVSASTSSCTAWYCSPFRWRATSLDKFQAGDKNPVRSEGINDYLPRQLGTLLCVLFGGIQVIPLVVYTGQAKMRFASHPLWRITSQLQAAPVALGRQIQLVVCFLYLAQIDCSRQGVDGIPKRLTDRYNV